MNVEKLMKCAKKPSLYESGTSIMWTDPYISQQLLNCHIDPDNDTASRSNEKIDLIVEWILSKAQKSKMKVLDLGCGPGLYAEKFAKLGHLVTGVDFSQNSIDYAEKVSKKNGSTIQYHCDNYLNITFENEFDLVILIYLDFCVLKPDERKIVLDAVYTSLRDGGIFIFDVVNGNNIDEKIMKPSWEMCSSGFWRKDPYIVLNKGYHYVQDKVLLNQHIVIDEKGEIETYLFWSSYYEDEDLRPILNTSRFSTIRHFENVLPKGDVWNGEGVTFYVVEKKKNPLSPV